MEELEKRIEIVGENLNKLVIGREINKSQDIINVSSKMNYLINEYYKIKEH